MQVAGHTAVFDDIDGRTDYHSGYATGFQETGDQTHGLVTNRSQRHQYGDIDLILVAAFEYFGCVIFQRITLAVLGWHCIEAMGNIADAPFVYQYGELLKRQE